ncbi:MAG: GAF domain-containing SpoIIE family protein phosphatase [candidate division Zixibacteria bacterium]|nr:GAF domain-containing SpoIIE family protein phosphatase [candidate division Zixibacteria bacterium]
MNYTSNHTKKEKLLLEAARIFNSTIEYEDLIYEILKLVMTAVNCEAAVVFRVDHDRTNMRMRIMNHTDSEMKIFERELGQGVVGWVARYKEPVVVNDVLNDDRIDHELGRQAGVEIHSILTVPLIGRGQMIGVVEAINKTTGDFISEDVDVLIGLSNQIAVAIDNANLYRQLKQQIFEKDVLYEIGKELSGSLTLDEVLEKIINSLHQVINLDAAGVFVIDANSEEVDAIYSIGYGPEPEVDLHTKMGQGLVGYAAKLGEPIIVSDVSKDDRYIKSRSASKSELVVPINVDNRIVGVLNLESNELDAYNQKDVDLVTTFASHAGISIERARLHQKLMSSRQLEQQLKIARDIQSSFLPRDNPHLDGYDICGINKSSEEVGGDYYDFIKIIDSQTGIAIGDVSGKGIPASLIMASFRASLIAEIRNNYSIRTICQKVNDLLCESITIGNFVTAVYGVLDSKNHIFTFSNCGHNLPVLVRANGEVEYLKEGGQVLGVTTSIEFEERPLFIGKGDIFLFYTDGVSEVFDEEENEFGLERLIDIVKKNQTKSAENIKEVIYNQVRDFASKDHSFDDFTMIIIKREK